MNGHEQQHLDNGQFHELGLRGSSPYNLAGRDHVLVLGGRAVVLVEKTTSPCV